MTLRSSFVPRSDGCREGGTTCRNISRGRDFLHPGHGCNGAVHIAVHRVIMEKDIAKQIMGRMYACIDIFNEVVGIADAKCGKDEARVVRRAVGYALSEIQDRLTDPILREYPDLLPQGINYAPLKGPTLSEMATKIGLTSLPDPAQEGNIDE